ncbi:MAG: hypothetical protein WC734_05940 [Patescibacteria group bacterium]|jgi:hypothetical protein
MVIKWKEDCLKTEWIELLLKNPRLVFLALEFANAIGQAITVTSIFRRSDNGVHGYWRGIDLSVRGFGLSRVEEIVERLNARYPYDPKRKKMVTYLLHDVGFGLHLHIQTMTEAKEA